MQKKDFWKGFATAIAAVAAAAIVWHSIYLLPIQLPSFLLSDTAKIRLLDHYLEKYYVEDYDEEMTEELMYTGLLAGVGDPYTYYLTKDALQAQMEKNSGHFVGVGVTVFHGDDGYLHVESVTKDSPAQQAGILPEDQIIRVDGTELASLPYEEAVSRIKGKEGTKVVISVFRPSTGEAIDFSMERKDIQVESVEWEMLQDNTGYIAIHNFRENTYEQFQKALQELQTQGMQTMVLDLRNNPGGLVNAAYQIGDEILSEGLMVYTMDKEGNRNELHCDAEYTDIPLAVLVNENSASASEILAGAIQDQGRGTLIGTSTFGKGLVQRLFVLPDGSGVNITIQKYYTPKGRSIHGTGIFPDISIELPKEYAQSIQIPKEHDIQLQKAQEILKQK